MKRFLIFLAVGLLVAFCQHFYREEVTVRCPSCGLDQVVNQEQIHREDLLQNIETGVIIHGPSIDCTFCSEVILLNSQDRSPPQLGNGQSATY